MKRYIIFIIFVCIFLVSSIYSYKLDDKDYSKENILNESKLLNSTGIEYYFISTKHNLNKISLKFDYKNNLDSNYKINIQLLDNHNKKVASKRIKIDDLNIHQSYDFKFDLINNSLNKNYKIKLESNSDMDNIKIESIEVYYFHNSNIIIYLAILSIITLLTLVIGFTFARKNIKIEKSYLILSIFIYSLYILLFPLFTTHDELFHWFRAYEVSEGNLLSDINENQAKTLLPRGVSDVHNKDYYDINYRTLKQTYNTHLDRNNRIYHDMSTVALYSPVQYVSQALGIMLSRIVTDRPLIMAYCGRIMNALISIILLYFSIKLIPFGKRAIFTIAFLPVAIEGFASLSADAITISISIFLLSYILNIIFNNNKKVNIKDYIIILISSIILSLCKIVYIPMVLLTFMIPKSKYKSKKHYILFNLSILVISISCNLIWLSTASKYLNLYNDAKVVASSSKLSPSTQVKSMLYHPINYIQMLMYTILKNCNHYLFTMLGENLGWGEVVYSLSIIPIVFFIMLIINSMLDKSIKNKLNLKMNVIFAFIVTCVVLLIFSSLYVQFTPPGSKTITGVQGRYFIPILPLILLLASNFRTNCLSKINLDVLTMQICLILNYSVLLTLLVYFL